MTGGHVPTPGEIKSTRRQFGLTQKQAADLIHSTDRAWRMWERGDRSMNAAFWELFCMKAEHPELFIGKNKD